MATDLVRFRHTREGTYTVVTPTGEVDLATAPSVREHLKGLLDAGYHQLVVDLDELDFLGVTALGVLVDTDNRARALGGRLELRYTRPGIVRLLRAAGLHHRFPGPADAGAGPSETHEATPSADTGEEPGAARDAGPPAGPPGA